MAISLAVATRESFRQDFKIDHNVNVGDHHFVEYVKKVDFDNDVSDADWYDENGLTS